MTVKTFLPTRGMIGLREMRGINDRKVQNGKETQKLTIKSEIGNKKTKEVKMIQEKRRIKNLNPKSKSLSRTYVL